MYINSGYLNNSRTDFKDNSTPLVVGSCGTYRLKTRPNLPTYWQKGRRDYQILYVANGKTHFWFDGKEEIVSAGHMVLYKPEEIQKYVYYLEDNPEVFWIHFTGSDVKNILAYHGISLDEHVFYCGVLPDYKALFRKIIQELQLCRYGYEDYIASLFNDILLLVDRQQHEQKKATGDVQEQIERAAAYFNENYNTKISMFISSFAGASEQNTAGCKQAADDALKLFATNEKIKNALRKSASYEQSISPATLETSSIYIYIPDEKLKIYGDLLRIITAQSMEYFSSRPPENKQTILFCLDEFASFGKLQIVESLRKLRKRRIRILVLTQSVSDVDMIYGKDERKAMLGNFKFTVILGCKDTETQEYFSKMIGEKRSLLATDPYQKPQPIIKPADLAHLEQDLFVICDDGAIRLKKNFYFK